MNLKYLSYMSQATGYSRMSHKTHETGYHTMTNFVLSIQKMLNKSTANGAPYPRQTIKWFSYNYLFI
jgi:hypothetical protein